MDLNLKICPICRGPGVEQDRNGPTNRQIEDLARKVIQGGMGDQYEKVRDDLMEGLRENEMDWNQWRKESRKRHLEYRRKIQEERQEATRQEAVRLEEARQEEARQEVARQEAVREEAAREEEARQEAARQEVAREEAAREEATREEASQHEALVQRMESLLSHMTIPAMKEYIQKLAKQTANLYLSRLTDPPQQRQELEEFLQRRTRALAVARQILAQRIEATSGGARHLIGTRTHRRTTKQTRKQKNSRKNKKLRNH